MTAGKCPRSSSSCGWGGRGSQSPVQAKQPSPFAPGQDPSGVPITQQSSQTPCCPYSAPLPTGSPQAGASLFPAGPGLEVWSQCLTQLGLNTKTWLWASPDLWALHRLWIKGADCIERHSRASLQLHASAWPALLVTSPAQRRALVSTAVG